MPRSKRAKKESLTQTKKKGLALKQKLIEDVQSCAQEYSHAFTFCVKNMRNIHLKDVRQKWAGSRFFFGKNKVMILALGKTPADEFQSGLHHLSKHLRGETGLLFTNKKKKEVLKFFDSYKVEDYARSGDTATETVVLKAGPVDMEFCHSLEPQLRQLGLPTSLSRGVITLNNEHQVCKKGQKLSPEQGRILKLFGYTMAHFQIKITGMWTKETGEWETLKPRKAKTDDDQVMETEEDGEDNEEEDEDAAEEDEAEDDDMEEEENEKEESDT